MSKEDLIGAIEAEGCKMLVELPLEHMEKADIVAHLQYACCEVLKGYEE